MIHIDIELARLPACAQRNHPALRAMAHALRDRLIRRACAPASAAIELAADDNGKPQLRRPAGWHFNLSHSRDAAAVALARRPIGVDLEYLQRRGNWSGIAERSFHAAEQAQLAALPSSAFAVTAVKLWTAKEAWSKARGCGLAGFAEAPQMHWDGECWQAPAGDSLRQWALAQGLWLSVYLPDATAVEMQLHCLQAQPRDNGFAFVPEATRIEA